MTKGFDFVVFFILEQGGSEYELFIFKTQFFAQINT